MTKLVQNDIASLTNEQSALAALNANYALLEVFSDSVLSRDGTSPNQMTADLDMNSNHILNLPDPLTATEPLRVQDLTAFTGTGLVIPQASYLTLATNSLLTNERVLTAGTGVTFADAGAGSTLTVNLDGDLTAVAGLSTNGLVTRTTTNTMTTRSLTQPAAGLTITNNDGVSGNPTFALANDLGALEALSGTNTIYYRSATDTWTPVTIVGPTLTFTAGSLAVPVREMLSASRTYFVRTDGSDSNTGLVNSAGGAFLTIQKAVDTVCNNLDIGTQTVTISVADGTYTGAVILKNYVGAGPVIIQGNTTTPANCIISTTSASCVDYSNINTRWQLKGFRLKTTTSGHCIFASAGNGLLELFNMDFNTVAQAHMQINGKGVVCRVQTNYAITGGGERHIFAAEGAYFHSSGNWTVTLTGTPAFSQNFAFITSYGHYNCFTTTFSGSATGTRYLVDTYGLLDTGGGGVNFLPGNAAGSGTNPATSPYGYYK